MSTSPFTFDRSDTAANVARSKGVSRQYVSKKRAPELEPELDEDGYPTEETLKAIRLWPIRNNFNVRELLKYCQKAWAYPNYFKKPQGIGRERYRDISTAGWSGNESIIQALEENKIFWIFCWLRSERGGHYRFLISPFVKEQP